MLFHCTLVVLFLTLTLNSPVRTGEIIRGHEAKPHSRPYMVFIKLHLQNGITEYCDGFILSEDFVMTAAHCQARSYTVLLGLHNVLDENEIQRISVTEAFPHEDFNSNDFSNDIMLLKLSSKAKFTQNVSTIALPSQTDDSLPKSCSFSGWGSTGVCPISLKLMEINLKLINSKMCKENSYCSEGETGPGRGDSGGPLVCEDGKVFGVLCGCNEWKPRLCAFTKISDYKDWIDSIIKEPDYRDICI